MECDMAIQNIRYVSNLVSSTKVTLVELKKCICDIQTVVKILHNYIFIYEPKKTVFELLLPAVRMQPVLPLKSTWT